MRLIDVVEYLDNADPLWWNLGFCVLLVIATMLFDNLMGWTDDEPGTDTDA